MGRRVDAVGQPAADRQPCAGQVGAEVVRGAHTARGGMAAADHRELGQVEQFGVAMQKKHCGRVGQRAQAGGVGRVGNWQQEIARLLEPAHVAVERLAVRVAQGITAGRGKRRRRPVQQVDGIGTLLEQRVEGLAADARRADQRTPGGGGFVCG